MPGPAEDHPVASWISFSGDPPPDVAIARPSPSVSRVGYQSSKP
jgi:hypothetical protein